jgi:hypothetical protein
VSRGSGYCLLARRAPGCHVSCGPLWGLVGLLVPQGSPAPNARTHVSKLPDVRAIMGL